MNRVFIANDHAGFNLKQQILNENWPFQWIDLGTSDEQNVDYPDYADLLCQKVIQTKDPGLLICGSGQGMAMRANKYQEIRAALCYDEEMAKMARLHNDANILCLAGRRTQLNEAKKIITTFFNTLFEGGRHANRVMKISKPI